MYFSNLPWYVCAHMCTYVYPYKLCQLPAVRPRARTSALWICILTSKWEWCSCLSMKGNAANSSIWYHQVGSTGYQQLQVHYHVISQHHINNSHEFNFTNELPKIQKWKEPLLSYSQKEELDSNSVYMGGGGRVNLSTVLPCFPSVSGTQKLPAEWCSVYYPFLAPYHSLFTEGAVYVVSLKKSYSLLSLLITWISAYHCVLFHLLYK